MNVDTLHKGHTDDDDDDDVTLQCYYREALEVYRLERGAYKNMATENVVHNTTCTVHNRYYSRRITRRLKIA